MVWIDKQLLRGSYSPILEKWEQQLKASDVTASICVQFFFSIFRSSLESWKQHCCPKSEKPISDSLVLLWG